MAGFNAEQLNIIISARTQDLQKELDKSQRRIKGFERSAGQSLSNTSRSFSALGKVAGRMASVLVAALSVRAIQNAASYAQELKNLSTLAGISASELQALGAASRTVGISTEKLADIYKDMNDRVGDFLQTGGGPMADFFENIAPMVGVTADQFARLSGPESLQLFVSSLEAANLTSSEMVFYLEAMASDASALIPLLRDNGMEMGRLASEARETGRVLEDDAVVGLAALNEKLKSASDEIRTEFMTALTSSQDELIALADFVRDYGIPAFEGLLRGAAAAASAIRTVADAIAVVNAYRTGQMGQYVDPENLLIGIPFDTPGQSNMTDEQARMLYGPDINLPPSVDGDTPSGSAPLKLTLTPSSNTPSTSEGGGTGGGNDWAAEIARLRDEYTGLLKSMDPVVAAELEFAENAELVNRALAAGVITTDQQAQVMGKLREQMNEAKLAASEFAGVADTLKSGLENAFMSILDGTESAKDAFRSMATDVIRELYRVLVVQELVGSFNTGGGGILGMIAPMFGRAGGGSVMAGQPYMVGEHGREPFIPAQNGRILSTAQAKDALSGGGGGTIVINQSINVTTGVQQTVRAEVMSLMPRIAEATKASVMDARKRGGSFAAAF